MNELLSDKLWTTIRRLGKKAAVRRAAISYVTNDKYLAFDDGDVLVTDASDGAIASGQTCAAVLARAEKRGACLYSQGGLHCKVMLLDGVAVIGSANLSEASTNSLIEAAWVTDNPAAAGMAMSLIQELVSKAKRIDDEFLDGILKIKVERGGRRGVVSTTHRKIKTPTHRTWVVGVHELKKEYSDENGAIAEGTAIAEENVTRDSSDVSWIRWTGNSRFRHEAKKGDSVIQIWSERGKKRPIAVYRHAPIVHCQKEQRCTRLFVEQFANEDKLTIAWKDFVSLCKRVGLAHVGKNSSRPISETHANAMFALWADYLTKRARIARG